MPRRSGSALSPAVATPSTPTSPPSAFILVDRHIEKNAGSTFRELLFQNERRGLCNYWGYQLRSTPWRIFAKLMEDESNLESPDDAPLRLCIEAHSHIDYGVPWLTRMRSLVEWRKRLRGKLKVVLLFSRAFLALSCAWSCGAARGAVGGAQIALILPREMPDPT